MQITTDVYADFVAARDAADAANARLKEAQLEVIADMERKGHKSNALQFGGSRYQFTVSKKRTVIIDEKGLRKSLGAKAFDSFTEKKFVRKLLEEAIEKGEVDQMVVSQHIDLKVSEPYLTFTAKETEDGS